MAKSQKPTPIERPCSTCGHLHDGIPCMEDGCDCQFSVPAEVPPTPQIDTRTDSEVISAGGEPAGGNTEVLKSGMESVDPTAQQPTPYDAGLRNTLPIQERIANLIEDFEDENSQVPIGCELVVSGRVYAWNGERMVESQEAVPDPPAAPVAATELSEDDQAKLREFFAEQTPLKELPDGSVQVAVIVPAEMVEVLKAWADQAQEPWPLYLQRTLEMGLNAVVNGGAIAG
jgi:hypothetical protein